MSDTVICDVDGTVTAPVLYYQQLETKSHNSHNKQITHNKHPEYPFKLFDQYNKEAVDMLRGWNTRVSFITAGEKGWPITRRWADHFMFPAYFTKTLRERVELCSKLYNENGEELKFYIGDSKNDIETVRMLKQEHPDVIFAATINPLTVPLCRPEIKPDLYLPNEFTLAHFANILDMFYTNKFCYDSFLEYLEACNLRIPQNICLPYPLTYSL